MKGEKLDVDNLTHHQYWRLFDGLLNAANVGATTACMGWIFYWLDLVPNPVFHTEILSWVFFLTSLAAGLTGTVIMILTRNRLGTKNDRLLSVLQISYSLIAAVSGIMVQIIYPSH